MIQGLGGRDLFLMLACRSTGFTRLVRPSLKKLIYLLLARAMWLSQRPCSPGVLSSRESQLTRACGFLIQQGLEFLHTVIPAMLGIMMQHLGKLYSSWVGTKHPMIEH